MTNQDTKINEVKATDNSPKPAITNPPTSVNRSDKPNHFGKPPFSGRGRRGGSNRSDKRAPKERVKPEFDTKVIQMRRVTRVTKGGRRMSFSVAVVSGDRKGRVGVGLGKSIDTSIAIDKATRDAKKNMIRINHTPSMSVPHDVYTKYSSARVMIMPAKGKGLIAGSAIRNVLDLAGLKDINAKILSGSKNQLNIARAAIKALSMMPRVNFRSDKKEIEKREVK